MVDDRPETMTPLEEAAARLNEVFTALIQAGFTEAQSLLIVTGLLRQHEQ